MNEEKKESYWSKFVEDYEERQEFVVGKELIEAIKHQITFEENLKDVLELGCGTGLFTEIIAQRSNHITATDFSEEMIENAMQFRNHLSNVNFEPADAMNLNYQKNSFDTVFAANLIHVISDPQKVIEESRKVLKSSGKIIITSFDIYEMKFIPKIRMVFRYVKTFGKVSNESKKTVITAKRVVQMLEANNFEIEKNLIIGNKTKSMYIVASKKSD